MHMTYRPPRLTQYCAVYTVWLLAYTSAMSWLNSNQAAEQLCGRGDGVFTTGKTGTILKVCDQYARLVPWLSVKAIQSCSSHTFLRGLLSVRENKTKETGELVSVVNVATLPDRCRVKCGVALQGSTRRSSHMQCNAFCWHRTLSVVAYICWSNTGGDVMREELRMFGLDGLR